MYVLGCCRAQNHKQISDVDFCFFYSISQKTEVNVKLYTCKIPPVNISEMSLLGQSTALVLTTKITATRRNYAKNHKVQNAHKLTLTEAKWPELKCKPHKNKNLNEQCEVYMCTPCAQSRYTTQVIQHTRVPIIFSHIQSLLLGRCLQVGWGISYAYGKPRYTKCHVTVDVILLRYSPLK